MAGAVMLAGRNLTYGMLDALGRAIVTGAYNGPRFPTEAVLTEQFAVSRSVTREAVKMLTAKGLLTARPRRGTSVQPVSMWNLFDADVLGWMLDREFSLTLLRQFTELRIAIEPEAAALAAKAGDDAAFARISAGLDRMMKANAEQALDADIAFHVAVLDASGNPFYAQFRDIVATALRTSIRFTSGIVGHSTSLPDHRAVHDAIADADPDAARAAMRSLIVDVMKLIDDADPG